MIKATYVIVALCSFICYQTTLFGYFSNDYQKFHHDRVQSFYGNILVDYHEYHKGYLTLGLFRNLTTGKPIVDFIEAAENLYGELGQQAGLSPNSQVLDVACGMGAQDLFFVERFGCTNITAVDLTDKHVAIATKRMEKYHLTDKVRVIHASGTDLPFDDNSFSHVLCVEGGQHMHTREDFFNETMRVLKPGGKFAYSETTLGSNSDRWIPYLLLRLTAWSWVSSADNFYGNEEYIAKLKRMGFENINLQSLRMDVYPDYQRAKWEDRHLVVPVRGWLVTYVSTLIDYFLRLCGEYDVLDYVIVTGQKPVTQLN